MAKLLLNPRNLTLGSENILLSATARRHFTAPFPGPLSVKTVVRGEGRWKTTEGDFLVNPSNLLILNQHQEYSLTIDSPQPVETFCLFFRPGFIQDAAYAARTSSGNLLDEPLLSAPFAFAERTLPAVSDLGQRLRLLHDALPANPEPLWLEAQLFNLASSLVDLTLDARRRAAALPAARPSTREELFRRVGRARAFMAAHFQDDSISVEQAARAACLSPYHFQRVFHRAFGITPHRYIVDLRLARALHLLRTTHLPVIDVCADVGFTSLGSFSTLFRARFGITPARARIEQDSRNLPSLAAPILKP